MSDGFAQEIQACPGASRGWIYSALPYRWAREKFAADAIVHYGTHGSQEWLPGKERRLSVYDYPWCRAAAGRFLS